MRRYFTEENNLVNQLSTRRSKRLRKMRWRYQYRTAIRKSSEIECCRLLRLGKLQSKTETEHETEALVNLNIVTGIYARRSKILCTGANDSEYCKVYSHRYNAFTPTTGQSSRTPQDYLNNIYETLGHSPERPPRNIIIVDTPRFIVFADRFRYRSTFLRLAAPTARARIARSTPSTKSLSTRPERLDILLSPCVYLGGKTNRCRNFLSQR